MKNLKNFVFLFFCTMMIGFFSCSEDSEDFTITDIEIDTTIENDVDKHKDYPPEVDGKQRLTNIEAESGLKVAGTNFINGSFENGFDGWNVEETGPPFRPWAVTVGGQGGGFGMFQTVPQDGYYSAWNGFDGGGPMDFIMWQEILVPPNAQLNWVDRIQWNFTLGSTATMPRTFEVQLRDPSDNSILETIYSFSTGTQDTNPTGNTGFQSHAINISSYEGQTVRVYFVEHIPEASTGPGQMEFDAIEIVEGDLDGDGVFDIEDNCPNDPNPGQEDYDQDGQGDVCDDDDDNDGILDTEDNCPFVANPDQNDYDSDGIGDVCDIDSDNDGCPDDQDEYPFSDLNSTFMIDGCDSGVPNYFDPASCGSNIGDLIMDCAFAEETQNHGDFVSCVAQLLNQAKSDGWISGSEKGAIQSCVAQSDYPIDP